MIIIWANLYRVKSGLFSIDVLAESIEDAIATWHAVREEKHPEQGSQEPHDVQLVSEAIVPSAEIQERIAEMDNVYSISED